VVVSEQAASALVLSTTDGRRSELTWTRTDGPLGVELDADTVEVLEYDRPLAALELLTTAGTVAWADRASEPFVPAPLPAPLRWVGGLLCGPHEARSPSELGVRLPEPIALPGCGRARVDDAPTQGRPGFVTAAVPQAHGFAVPTADGGLWLFVRAGDGARVARCTRARCEGVPALRGGLVPAAALDPDGGLWVLRRDGDAPTELLRVDAAGVVLARYPAPSASAVGVAAWGARLAVLDADDRLFFSARTSSLAWSPARALSEPIAGQPSMGCVVDASSTRLALESGDVGVAVLGRACQVVRFDPERVDVAWEGRGLAYSRTAAAEAVAVAPSSDALGDVQVWVRELGRDAEWVRMRFGDPVELYAPAVLGAHVVTRLAAGRSALGLRWSRAWRGRPDVEAVACPGTTGDRPGDPIAVGDRLVVRVIRGDGRLDWFEIDGAR
jgi:hypothetical protein